MVSFLWALNTSPTPLVVYSCLGRSFQSFIITDSELRAVPVVHSLTELIHSLHSSSHDSLFAFPALGHSTLNLD